MFNLRTYITERHYLKEDMSYWNACPAGGHALHEDMSCRRLCLTCGHLLLVDMS